MNTRFLFVTLFFLCFYGCANKPDLEITTFESNGPSRVNSEGDIEQPVKIVIKNRGEGVATGFDIVTEYLLPAGTFQADFVFTGMSFHAPAFDPMPLGAEREIHLLGTVIFPAKHHGWTAVLKARLQCCNPEDGSPEHEDQREAYTDNNESWPIQVHLVSAEMASLK